MIPPQLNNQKFIKVKDKQPIEKNWQVKGGSNYAIDDKSFLEYLKSNPQYGVVCGINDLVVIDFDEEGVMNEVLGADILPKTFSVKTARKGLLHLYYYCPDNSTSWKVLDKDKNTIADVQGKTKQVIGPGSKLPDGREYVVVDDLPIANISSNIIHKALDQYDYKRTQELLQQTSDELTLDDFNKSKDFGPDLALEEVRRRLKVSDVLRDAGISTGKNPTQCPFHSSKGGKCLGFDDKKGIWSCFHCSEKGTAIDLWMKLHNISEFVDAKRKLCEELGIEDNYIPPALLPPPIPSKHNGKPNVQLPEKHRTVGDFADALAIHFKECLNLFYKVDEKNLVEVDEYYDKQLRQLIVGFSTVPPGRLLNLIEERVNTYSVERIKKQEIHIRKSANEQTIKLVSTNTPFLNCLHKIKRLLNYPIPFINTSGKLIIPHKGYDEDYQAYFTPNTPELNLMDVDAAKNLLYEIISEFCFKEDIDRDMALSYIITPMCRGLYKESTERTPLYIIQANRERAGKDYLAGMVGIIYEGRAIDDTPFVTGDKMDNGAEEWRKKFTSALKIGRRRIHSSNNRGFLNNAVLEQFLTSQVWSDRQLGGNMQLELNNEIDVSMSANIGLTYTADIWFRARPINLFFGEENPNERTYKRTDLWGYVRQNRGLLLSAIYTLIRTWYDAGQPKSSIPFTSFPEWSRVVGGVMEYHQIGNPCKLIEDEGVGGDLETHSMKELFTFMATYQHNHQESKGFTISDIRRIIIDAQSSEDFEGFSGWDLAEKSYQTKFGLLIRRFVNRFFDVKSPILGEDNRVQLIVAVPNDRSVRILYMFKTTKPPVRPPKIIHKVLEEESVSIVEESIGVTPEIVSEVDEMVKILIDKEFVAIDYLIAKGISEDTINECLLRGIIYSVKAGFVGLLK